MFCPHCEAEYRPGFTECKDCQVALVDRLQEHPAISADERDADADYVVVATVNGPLETLRLFRSSSPTGFLQSSNGNHPQNVQLWDRTY